MGYTTQSKISEVQKTYDGNDPEIVGQMSVGIMKGPSILIDSVGLLDDVI